VGDSAVDVRHSTWTASLPGEPYSATWITSYLRTVVQAAKETARARAQGGLDQDDRMRSRCFVDLTLRVPP
jgi:hypothetical protein